MFARFYYQALVCSLLLALGLVEARSDITGTVTLVGKPGSPEKTVYSGTVTGCGGNGYHTSEHWKVGPKGELADVVVWVVDPKLIAPITPDPNPKPAPNPKMNQAQCTYIPYVIATTPSVGVEFVNSDSVLHNVLARTSQGADQADGDVVFNLPEIEGQHAIRSFDTPGLYTLQCSSHNWMQAWVYVLPESCAGFFAVTDKSGAFAFGTPPYTLADGDYVVKAWHSRFQDPVEGKLHCVHGSGTVQLVFQGAQSF